MSNFRLILVYFRIGAIVVYRIMAAKPSPGILDISYKVRPPFQDYLFQKKANSSTPCLLGHETAGLKGGALDAPQGGELLRGKVGQNSRQF